MIIYPAIDLINGQCVRLLRGDFSQQTRYQHDPLALALDYRRQGAVWLHLVDLDAAADPTKRQSESISRLANESDLKIQVGGGVRSKAEAEQLLRAGCSRVVIGSLAVHQPEMALDVLQQLGPDKVAFAFDVQHHEGRYYLCSSGWREQSSLELFDTLAHWVKEGLIHLVCTDISRDGTLAGPNTELYRQLRQNYPRLAVQASGGVANLKDLQFLRQAGASGAITGKALLEGRFTLADALRDGGDAC